MDTESLNSELDKFVLVYFYFHFIFVLFQKKKEDVTIFAYFIWLRQSFVFPHHLHIW